VSGLVELETLPFVLACIGVATSAWCGWRPASAPARSRSLVTLLLAVYVVVFACVAAAWPQKNLRFLSPIVAPAAWLAGDALVRGLEGLGAWRGAGIRRAGIALAAVALVVMIGVDAARFQRLFIRLQIPDLATPWFRRSHP
jgi:hypothetical protein